MTINFDPLKKAFLILQEAMERAKQNPVDRIVQDACIQRFEYSYELSVKFIKRYLQEEYPVVENVDILNYRDLIRVAAEVGLIEQVESWFQFREAWNITSHAYDEKKAMDVFRIIPDFIQQVHFFLEKLEKKSANND